MKVLTEPWALAVVQAPVDVVEMGHQHYSEANAPWLGSGMVLRWDLAPWRLVVVAAMELVHLVAVVGCPASSY